MQYMVRENICDDVVREIFSLANISWFTVRKILEQDVKQQIINQVTQCIEVYVKRNLDAVMLQILHVFWQPQVN
jgi:hypothetical protein